MMPMNSLETASRPIMWNLEGPANTIVMYLLAFAAMVIAGFGLLRHAQLVISGKKDTDSASLLSQATSLLTWGVLQRGVIRQRGIALSHSLIYFGFLVLLFTTTMVMLDHDFGIPIYRGTFYLNLTILSDLFGFGVIIGCLLAAHRRLIAKPDHLHTKSTDWYMLWMLLLLCVQGFLLEGLRIHATNDPWKSYSFVGEIVAQGFWALSIAATRHLHFVVWWFHAVTVFLFIALIPYSKFFHIIASSVNLFFRDRRRPLGAVRSPGDLEKMMEEEEEFSLGLGTIADYSWKHLLDLEACTSCGRCQDACPAYNSGKPLSPKWMILDTRNHALSLQATGKLNAPKMESALTRLDSKLTLDYLSSGSGLRGKEDGNGFDATGDFRANNELVQNSPLTLGNSVEDRIAGDVISQDVFWSCNTCFACVEACPVGINHVDMIVENRQNMVLMHGEIPSEASNTLRALETRSNPFGAPEDRANWLQELDVPILQPGDTVDYLYWVGCVSAYDPRKQKIAQALVKIMNAAGLSFGVLGNAEGCSGDPARRLGEENLFQMLAKQNIELLKSLTFKTIVANCPHCFNTIKNEYPQFGNLGNGKTPEIVHHSVLLKKLLAEKKLHLRADGESSTFTFHDPCYLGRVNNEYEAPRDTLKNASSKLTILEMDRSCEKSMCCGAGGGHFWMDMKVGERVNSLRVDQAAATGAQHIATACPFCMQMLEDGIKLTDREDSMDVRDIAEVIADHLITEN
ncbi:MAG: 4Fe-4S dicluster domain-containing protein [Bdellovibrionales bacterium]|nr:4Fe-4S dicluster domain-containing protein [Bdellovibrionales bacterium]